LHSQNVFVIIFKRLRRCALKREVAAIKMRVISAEYVRVREPDENSICGLCGYDSKTVCYPMSMF